MWINSTNDSRRCFLQKQALWDTLDKNLPCRFIEISRKASVMETCLIKVAYWRGILDLKKDFTWNDIQRITKQEILFGKTSVSGLHWFPFLGIVNHWTTECSHERIWTSKNATDIEQSRFPVSNSSLLILIWK